MNEKIGLVIIIYYQNLSFDQNLCRKDCSAKTVVVAVVASLLEVVAVSAETLSRVSLEGVFALVEGDVVLILESKIRELVDDSEVVVA